MTWKYFNGNQDTPTPLDEVPESPPWRSFLPASAVPIDDDERWEKLREIAVDDKRAISRGRNFQIVESSSSDSIVDAVNAAIHLRRPLLVTGDPGSGKTSLAYAIAYELSLGPVLTWPITARSNLTDALYRYDAIARLQDAQLDKMRQNDQPIVTQLARAFSSAAQVQSVSAPSAYLASASGGSAENSNKEESDLGEYIQLGPVGTAFLPSKRPRILLIDEIDKSDLNLPNDLLNLFEEGEFEIPELVRRSKRAEQDNRTVMVRTADKGVSAQPITDGFVRCCEFPLVIMTSNGERDFPPAFYRRCLRLNMPSPTSESLKKIVESHFVSEGQALDNEQTNKPWSEVETQLEKVISDFLGMGPKADRATDQLLNAVYVRTRKENFSDAELERLDSLLLKRLND